MENIIDIVNKLLALNFTAHDLNCYKFEILQQIWYEEKENNINWITEYTENLK